VTLLAATGLRREARILAGPGLVAIPGGGRSETLEARLSAAAADARAIISIGLAGALADGLAPGDWVVAEAVIADGAAFPTDAAWREALLGRLPHARLGDFLGSEAMLAEAGEKQTAHAATGAVAVDMESRVAARVARRFGLPFAAARVISDAADRSLPAAVKVGMTPEGGMALGPVLAALARDPTQLPALIRTGRDAEAAFRALAGGRRLLGPRLGLPDFLELSLDVG
jgi:adenosylhomocysteine nucleosidase